MTPPCSACGYSKPGATFRAVIGFIALFMFVFGLEAIAYNGIADNPLLAYGNAFISALGLLLMFCVFVYTPSKPT